MTTILPFLLLLVCPIAMILMMRGMMHGHKSPKEAADQSTDKSLNLTQLRELRDDLDTRIEDLDARIYELEASRPTTGATTTVTDS
jgi:hypothetical protein